jgi:surfeit locus 1 family protein
MQTPADHAIRRQGVTGPAAADSTGRGGSAGGYRERVLSTALKPRWLAVLALVLLVATGMARLGQWQWDRAQEQGRLQTVRAAASRPQVPLTSLLAPQQSFTNQVTDRPVTVRGRWDPAHQLLVADRYLSDQRGWWVLTPLVIDQVAGGTSGTSGAAGAIAVVRGWVPSAQDAAAAPSALPAGPVELAGVLRPGEPPIDRDPGVGSGLPDGQIDGVDLTQLVRRWPYRLITGYLVMTQQRPAPAGAGLRVVPPTAPGSRSLAWQNLSYAVQWFVFAGFGLFMWWRLVRDDHRGRLRGYGTAASGARNTSDDDHDASELTAPEPVPDRGAP